MTPSELQTALSVGGRVDLTAPVGPLLAPLELPAGTWLDLHGHVLTSGYTDPATGRLGPVLMTGFGRGYPQLTGIERGTLIGGVQFRVNEQRDEAALFRLADLRIQDGDVGIDDVGTGAWMGTIDRVWVSGTRIGIRHHSGTTWTLTACHVSPAEIGYDFFGAYTTTLIGCAADNCSQHVLRAERCRGLALVNLHGEHSTIPGGALIRIVRTTGLVVNGLWTVGNTFTPSGCAGYLLEIYSSIGVLQGLSVGGGTRDTPDLVNGQADGHTVGMLLHGTNRLTITGSHIASLTPLAGCLTFPNWSIVRQGNGIVRVMASLIEGQTEGNFQDAA